MSKKIEIPIKVLRRFISEVLIERSNKIMDDCNEFVNEDLEQIEVATSYSLSLGNEACGTRVLADDVLYGAISIEEAMEEILTRGEMECVKNKCLDWLKNKKEEIKV